MPLETSGSAIPRLLSTFVVERLVKKNFQIKDFARPSNSVDHFCYHKLSRGIDEFMNLE